MANVLIRNIPDAVLQRYRAHAAARGVPVSTLLREVVVRDAPSPNGDDALAAFDALRAQTVRTAPSAADLIRADRDNR